MVYAGICYIVIGLLFFSFGIKSDIPRPDKGSYFLNVKDGYVIKYTKLNDYIDANGEEVNVLIYRKVN
jgi:hypothetical protein